MRFLPYLLLLLSPALAAELTLTPKDGGEPVKIDTTKKSEVTLAGKTYLVAPAEVVPTLKKARAITIPRVDFADTSVAEAIDFFRLRSMELDPDKTGANFVVIGTEGMFIPSLQLRNASLETILGFVAEMTGAKVEYRDHAIVVSGTDRGNHGKAHE